MYKSSQKLISHNYYILDRLSYQSNYSSGLRIVNITSINGDDSSALFEETRSFNVRPEDDEAGGEATFNSA